MYIHYFTDEGGFTVTETSEVIVKPFGWCVPDDRGIYSTYVMHVCAHTHTHTHTLTAPPPLHTIH